MEANGTCRDELAVDSHSERALALIDAVLGDAGWRLADLDGIAFGAGPGSFTGLRVGCGIAQGLALGADLPLAPVPTLLALALAAGTAHGATRVVACLDARMREVYVANVERGDAGWIETEPARVLAPALVAPPPEPGWLGAGNGFAAYPELAGRSRSRASTPRRGPTRRRSARSRCLGLPGATVSLPRTRCRSTFDIASPSRAAERAAGSGSKQPRTADVATPLPFSCARRSRGGRWPRPIWATWRRSKHRSTRRRGRSVIFAIRSRAATSRASASARAASSSTAS
jgi:tRNA threonylcarbamoyladenosine biosynthesis protein TsaB